MRDVFDCKRFTEDGWEWLGSISVEKERDDEEIIRIAEKKYGEVDNISNFYHVVM